MSDALKVSKAINEKIVLNPLAEWIYENLTKDGIFTILDLQECLNFITTAVVRYGEKDGLILSEDGLYRLQTLIQAVTESLKTDKDFKLLNEDFERLYLMPA